MMSIYYLFGLFLLCSSQVFAISDDMIEIITELHEGCVKETDVDESSIEKWITGIFLEDPQLKCYIKCMMEKVPPMDSDEDTGMESMNELIPNEYKGIIERIIRDCEAIKGVDECDTAFLIFKCWYIKGQEAMLHLKH